MKFNRLIPLALLCFAVPSAFAQEKGTRIAAVNPSRIFNEMQETKNLKESLEGERVRLTALEKEKREELQKLQNQRNQLKADTPQWDELNNKLMDAALEFQLWGQSTKAKAERNQKKQLKVLFDHIEQAVAEVAKRDGYDIVVADQRPDLAENIEQLNIDQVRALINSRNVLYVSPKADISDTVIALMDSKLKSGGAAPAAPAAKPAPAPAPAPAPKPAAPKQ